MKIESEFKTHSCRAKLHGSWRRTLSGWESTKKTFALSFTPKSPVRSKPTIKKLGEPAATEKPSECALLYDQADLETQVEFLKWSNPDADYYHRLYDLLKYDTDRVRAFGIDWLREKLSAKNRRDRRLETALGMLQRWSVIQDENDLSDIAVSGDLPDSLAAPDSRAAKLLRDQRKLYAMVEYVKQTDNPRGFIERYFGYVSS